MKSFMCGWSNNVVYPPKVTTDVTALRARVIRAVLTTLFIKLSEKFQK